MFATPESTLFWEQSGSCQFLTVVQANPGQSVLGLELYLFTSVGQELGSWLMFRC